MYNANKKYQEHFIVKDGLQNSQNPVQITTIARL